MLTLKGRTVERSVPVAIGRSLLDIALAHDIDWQFNCTRGTCARCRCLVVSGNEHLADITDEEWERLEDDEMESGYRLGCQAVVRSDGDIRAVNKPYF